LDVAFASALLVVTLPMSLVVALLIRATSRGPIIFSQTRIGQHGVPFTCYKFRTMVKNAEELLKDPELAQRFEVAWKLENDTRITPIGRWLRKTSLDELPQLLNVLRGEMSVVGPRPVQPRELDQRFGPWADIVTSVKPGLTSLWIVSGRSLLSYEDRVRLEVEYVWRRGLWFDAQLVLRTVSAVLRQRGAL
jgi:lipopolysaccharide/colanic/teichoic acid biosynthesis glycosyltransferase